MKKWIVPACLVVLFGLAAAVYFWLFAGLPSPQVSPDRLQSASVRFTDRSGRLLYEALPSTGGRHQVLPIDQIPAALRQATIATEDAHFYTNPGIDLAGILRALWTNLRGGETVAGGSTITQQVARNLLMDARERNERSLRRKLREAFLAWQLTRRYSKDEILAFYLNESYYGGLAYGVEAAAETYFGKPAGRLSLAECALLAGLPQAPAAYDPFTDPDAALARRSTVLRLMEKNGAISAAQRELADREPLALATEPYPLEAYHFVLMARAQVDRLFTAQEIATSGGLTVRTTLDLDAQRASEQAVTDQMQRLREKGQHGLGYNVNNAALVAIDPHTGEILAMVGSPDPQDAEHNGAINMALAPRQPGSALKPFIYAAAFDPTRPHPWTPATSLLDVTAHFVTHDNLSYTPQDYDGLERGPVSIRQALASSLNIPAVLTMKEIGLPGLFDLGSRVGLGLTGNPDQYDLSLALGGGEVRLIDLTAAYGAFATGGYRVEPYAILDVRDAQGRVRYQHADIQPRRVLDERVTWLITSILSDDAARQIGFGRNSILNLDRPAAVKTGTTTNFHDNWTVGYTPELVMGVWVGNASHEAMREVNGLTGAAPIWHQAMRAMLAGRPAQAFTRPQGLVQVEVCALSGLLPTPACPYRRTEWFIAGTQPNTPDTYYRPVELDARTGQLSDDTTPAGQRIASVALDLPPAAQNWARASGLLLWSDLQASRASAGSGTGSSGAGSNGAAVGGAVEPGVADQGQLEGGALNLTSPAALSIFHITSTLPRSAQSIPLTAVGPAGLTNLTIYVDGQQIARLAAPPYQVWWQLAPGKHQAWVEANGQDGQALTSPRVDFEVVGP